MNKLVTKTVIALCITFLSCKEKEVDGSSDRNIELNDQMKDLVVAYYEQYFAPSNDAKVVIILPDINTGKSTLFLYSTFTVKDIELYPPSYYSIVNNKIPVLIYTGLENFTKNDKAQLKELKEKLEPYFYYTMINKNKDDDDWQEVPPTHNPAIWKIISTNDSVFLEDDNFIPLKDSDLMLFY